MSAPEIRRDPDGDLDEIVARDAFFHLERMDNDGWWFSVEAGGKRYAVHFQSRDLHKVEVREEPASGNEPHQHDEGMV